MFSKLVGLIILVLLSPLFLLISINIYLFNGAPILFKQKRVGKNNSYFDLYKFRTMKINTPDVATHLLDKPEEHYIILGLFLESLV